MERPRAPCLHGLSFEDASENRMVVGTCYVNQVLLLFSRCAFDLGRVLLVKVVHLEVYERKSNAKKGRGPN